MKKNNENTNALILHLSSLFQYIFPLGGILVPLILWQTKKEENQYLNNQGKEVINFNISYLLYQFLLILIMAILFFIIFAHHIHLTEILKGQFHFNIEHIFEHNHYAPPIIFGLFFFFFSLVKTILIIIGALKAKSGENYKYPMTLKFIK